MRGPCRRGEAEPLWDPHLIRLLPLLGGQEERSADRREAGRLWSPCWASRLSLRLPAPLPFLSHSVPWPPPPAQAEQLRAADVAGLGLLRPPCPQEKNVQGRSPQLRSLSAQPQVIERGSLSWLLKLLPFANLWAQAPRIPRTQQGFGQHLQTGPFPPLTADPPTLSLRIPGLCQVREGEERGGEGEFAAACSWDSAPPAPAPAPTWPLAFQGIVDANPAVLARAFFSVWVSRQVTVAVS